MIPPVCLILAEPCVCDLGFYNTNWNLHSTWTLDNICPLENYNIPFSILYAGSRRFQWAPGFCFGSRCGITLHPASSLSEVVSLFLLTLRGCGDGTRWCRSLIVSWGCFSPHHPRRENSKAVTQHISLGFTSVLSPGILLHLNKRFLLSKCLKVSTTDQFPSVSGKMWGVGSIKQVLTGDTPGVQSWDRTWCPTPQPGTRHLLLAIAHRQVTDRHPLKVNVILLGHLGMWYHKWAI